MIFTEIQQLIDRNMLEQAESLLNILEPFTVDNSAYTSQLVLLSVSIRSKQLESMSSPLAGHLLGCDAIFSRGAKPVRQNQQDQALVQPTRSRNASCR